MAYLPPSGSQYNPINVGTVDLNLGQYVPPQYVSTVDPTWFQPTTGFGEGEWDPVLNEPVIKETLPTLPDDVVSGQAVWNTPGGQVNMGGPVNTTPPGGWLSDGSGQLGGAPGGSQVVGDPSTNPNALPVGGVDYSPELDADYGWRQDPGEWTWWKPTGEAFMENPYGVTEQVLWNSLLRWMDPRTQESAMDYLSQVNPEAFNAAYGNNADTIAAASGDIQIDPNTGIGSVTPPAMPPMVAEPITDDNWYADRDRIQHFLNEWDDHGGVANFYTKMDEWLGEDPSGERIWDTNTYGQGAQWLRDYLETGMQGMDRSPTDRASRAEQQLAQARLNTMEQTAQAHPSMAGMITLGQNMLNPLQDQPGGNIISDNRVIDPGPTSFGGQGLNAGLT